LVPGALTPWLWERLVEAGAKQPFARAAREVERWAQVRVSVSTARRATEQAGAAYVAVQTAEVDRLEREAPEAPPGPACQVLSVDGAHVPLVGGVWSEVKTLAVGTLEPGAGGPGRPEQEGQATDLSYFSRLPDHVTFGRLATVETQRRGTERAAVVCAVSDGADWIQGFIDLHRPDAVRILDFTHAADRLRAVAQALFPTNPEAATAWEAQQRHALRHQGADGVLATLYQLRHQQAGQPAGAVCAESLAYLEKRQAQLRYPAWAAAGYPLGSGMVESGNKLVIEARLKGAGMHWAPEQVDGMAALRTVECSAGDRWAEAWPQVHARVRWRAQAVPLRSRRYRAPRPPRHRARRLPLLRAHRRHPRPRPPRRPARPLPIHGAVWRSATCAPPDEPHRLLAQKDGAHTCERARHRK
jgi:hypothetical protein